MEALLNSKLRQGFGPSRVARIGPVRIMKCFYPIFLVLYLPEKTGWKHPEVRKCGYAGITLKAFVREIRQEYLSFGCERRDFIPIGSRRPIRFYLEFLRAVSAGQNSYGIVGAVCLYTEMRHHFESHFDIRRRNYFACESQLQSVLHIRCYHE